MDLKKTSTAHAVMARRAVP